jgi:SAM-dependent methyltransferase
VGADGVRCRACLRIWPVRRGVLCLGQGAGFPRDLSEARSADLLAIAESAGWQVAVHDFLRPLDPLLYRRAVDEYRSQWRCLLPRQPQARVLDLRCTWGPIAVNLAEDFGLVVAADPHFEMARFTALRAAALGLGNVRPVCLDPARRLPFPPGYFDVVVLHEIIEWIDPAASLAEIRRVLAPGGAVFLTAGNRLSLAHRMAGRTESGRAPKAAPRRLGEYRRALAAAGLAPRAAFAILPSDTEPFYLVPLGQRGALRYFLDNLFENAGVQRALAQRNLLGAYQAARLAWRLARHVPLEWLVQHVVPGYGLLAVRP